MGDPEQRRGRKSYFQGSRKEFLESRVAAYNSLKKGNRKNFWHELYSAWWERFPWKLPDNEEPPTDNPAKMVQLGSVAPGEEVVKRQVEENLTKVRWVDGYSPSVFS